MDDDEINFKLAFERYRAWHRQDYLARYAHGLYEEALEYLSLDQLQALEKKLIDSRLIVPHS